jgi:endonuclease/exonuclease/phosphatase family metal-dependent hydrolase
MLWPTSGREIPTSSAARRMIGRSGAALALAAVLLLGAWSSGYAVGQSLPGGTLDVASYNVQFVMPDLPVLRHLIREFPGQRPNVEARARAIGAALACYDVIALQETINDRRRAELLEQLETQGRMCGKPSRLPSGRMFAVAAGPELEDGSGWLPLVGDELALASRLPIVALDMIAFKEAAGADALAAKGVLHARIARTQDPADTLDAFTTHLQADDDRAEVRHGQIEELAALVRRRASAEGPVLVMGDFNLWGGNPDRADPGSEYNFLLKALDEAVAPRRFVDLWLATHPDDPETASGTKPRLMPDGTRRPREKRIDFMLLAGAGRARPLAMRLDFLPRDLIVDGKPLGDLSSHAALLAEIAWRAQAGASTAEVSVPQSQP